MKYITASILIMLFMACKKPQPPYNEISKIELARSGAWSDLGATISIDSSLNYEYFGDYGKVKQGYFMGKINRKFWDTLTQKFEEIKFKAVANSEDLLINDATYHEVIIHWKNQTKKIIRVSPREPDAVINAFRWIDSTYRRVKLHQVNNPIKFETTYHDELPKPLINNLIVFPPPIVKKEKHT